MLNGEADGTSLHAGHEACCPPEFCLPVVSSESAFSWAVRLVESIPGSRAADLAAAPDKAISRFQNGRTASTACGQGLLFSASAGWSVKLLLSIGCYQFLASCSGIERFAACSTSLRIDWSIGGVEFTRNSQTHSQHFVACRLASDNRTHGGALAPCLKVLGHIRYASN